MAHKITYAVLATTAVMGVVESQVQLLAGMFSPAIYGLIFAGVAILKIAVEAWRDYKKAQDHDIAT